MDQFKEIGYFFRKYLFQMVLFLIGITLITVGLTEDEEAHKTQNAWFIYGGLGVICAAIISTLYTIGIFDNRTLNRVMLFFVLPLGVILLSYLVYHSIVDRIRQDEMIKETKREVKQRLKDIRDAQVEFNKKYGKYAENFDQLKKFVRDDKSISVMKEGDVPDKISQEMLDSLGLKEAPDKGLSETQAWILAQKGVIKNFRRDTTFESVMEKLFTNDKAKATRDSKYPFSLDSMDIAPYTGGKVRFKIQTSSLAKNNVQIPLFLVIEPAPVGRDTLKVGSLTEVSTAGNWAE